MKQQNISINEIYDGQAQLKGLLLRLGCHWRRFQHTTMTSVDGITHAKIMPTIAPEGRPRLLLDAMVADATLEAELVTVI